MHPNVDRVVQAAVAAGLDIEPRQFPESTRTAAEAAAAIGVPVGAIVKSLVWSVDGHPVLALVSGEVHLMFPNAAAVAPFVKSGKLRALAVTTAQPSALLPGLPAVAASGIPGYESAGMTSVFAPARTPEAVINRLNQEIALFLNTPDTKEKFFNAGAEVVASSPQELGTKMKSEIERLGKELDDYRSRIFKEDYLSQVRPFPRVRELFHRIHDDGRCIVLATSGEKSDAKHFIELLGIDPFIVGYTSADDTQQSKPAPDIFSAALKKLGDIDAGEALGVGDTPFDVEAAKKIGLKTIALLCGAVEENILRQAGAVAIYRDPADLLLNYHKLSCLI